MFKTKCLIKIYTDLFSKTAPRSKQRKMSTKTYKDFKFTVNQVKLMSQLYDSGLTADEVIAGFKQIQDRGGKSKSNDSFYRSIIIKIYYKIFIVCKACASLFRYLLAFSRIVI